MARTMANCDRPESHGMWCDEDAQIEAEAQFTYEEERAAELRVERYFEERGYAPEESYGYDPYND